MLLGSALTVGGLYAGWYGTRLVERWQARRSK
jgi:hypothetical protein